MEGGKGNSEKGNKITYIVGKKDKLPAFEPKIKKVFTSGGKRTVPTTTLYIKGLQSFFTMVSQYRENKMDFYTVTTTNSRRLVCETTAGKEKYIFSDDFFPMNLLHYIRKIKEDVYSNAEKILASDLKDNPFEIEYYEFSQSIYEMGAQGVKGSDYLFETGPDQWIIEADISVAYFRDMLNKGWLSQKLHDELILLDKRFRLKILGTIATDKTTRYYEKGILVDYEFKDEAEKTRIKILRSAWFKVCYSVAQAMQVLKDSLGEGFLFYWVDGIYFTFNPKSPITLDELLEDLTRHFNFDWKIKRLHSLRIKNVKGNIEMKIIENKNDPEEDHRFFYPPKEKIVSYHVGTNKDFLTI